MRLSTALKTFGGFGTVLLKGVDGELLFGGTRFGSTSDEVTVTNLSFEQSFSELFIGNRARGLEGGDAANNTSITGYVMIAGYDGGIDPKTGEVNDTLVVEYDLQGCNGTCSILELEENSNFCECGDW